MAKRFTCSEKWAKKWYRLLTPEMKCFWFYILDKCDISGVWDVDIEHASFCIGTEINPVEALKTLKNHIVVLPNNKWWVKDFCDFQYGTLTETCNPHKAVIKLLFKHGLSYKALRVPKGVPKALKDKDKNQDQLKDKDKDKELPDIPFPNNNINSDDLFNELQKAN